MKYCVGVTMATDWGDEDDRPLDRRLVRRVLAYLRPYWRAALLAFGCLLAAALVGLVPAIAAAVAGGLSHARAPVPATQGETAARWPRSSSGALDKVALLIARADDVTTPAARSARRWPSCSPR